MSLEREQILDRLRKISYPGFTRDIVSAGVIDRVDVDDRGVVLTLALPDAVPAVEDKIRSAVLAALAPELPNDQVRFRTPHAASPPSLSMAGSRPSAASTASAAAVRNDLIPGVRAAIAVASGKGGVGKSTVAVNLAIALARQGQRVGLLDADIYGPSIPLMMGLEGERPRLDAGGKRLIPFERYGIRFMSLGFLVDPDSAVIWRGPMVMKALEQLLRDVTWGELDYLILDLPPGTGDAQLTLSQRIQLAGAVIVSTPQNLALADAVKAISMFRKVNVPILGLIENMSFFDCPHCSERTEIFGHGGARSRATALGLPFLGELSLDPKLREGGDSGRPIMEYAPESVQAERFASIAAAVHDATLGGVEP